MALIAYERDIPATANNPSVDQPDMRDNTNHIDDIISVDHYSFNNNNSGWHKQVTLPVASPFAAPPSTINQGVFYTNTANSATNVFYKNDGVADQYQMTRTNAANFATFGTYTNYNGLNFGGWTFLPGGLLYQYGRRVCVNGDTITFPIPFANASEYSISVVRVQGNTGSTWGANTLTTTGFNVSTDGGSSTYLWTAVGR